MDSTGNGWAVGENSLLRIEGDKIQLVRHPAWQRQSLLEAVWGSGPNDVWAVGNVVLHYDGSQWTELPEYTSKGMSAVWGTGPSDVWMVSILGTTHHYDGSTWKSVPSGTTRSLYTITGSSASDAWVGGQYGTLLRWNGTAWATTTGPTTDALGSLSCAASNDCWLLPFAYKEVSGKTLYHWDGIRWNKQSGTPDRSFFSVTAVSASEVWLTGPTTFRFDGTAWVDTSPGTTDLALSHVAARGGKEALGVGLYGHMARWTGTSWRTLSSGPKNQIHGVWSSPQGDVFFVGASGALARYRGGKLDWPGPPGTSATYFSVWGTSSQDVWVVGEYGRIIHYNGTSWTEVMSGSREHLRTITGTGPSDVWVVGDNRVFLHYDGSKFSDSPPIAGLSGAKALWFRSATEGWIGGTSGTLASWDGSKWSVWPKQFGRDITAIWGRGSSDVWATGGDLLTDPMVIRYNGTTWESHASPVGLHGPTSLWGTGALDLWMTSYYGGLAHWNGSAWQQIPLGTIHRINGIAGVGDSLFPAGEYGLVMKVKR